MKYLFLSILLLTGFVSVKGQKYTPPPFWTIWFTLSRPYPDNFIAHYDSTKCTHCDSLESEKSSDWVQSFDDSTVAYQYYHDLKHTGKVLIWNKWVCGIDAGSVYIDKYSVVLRKYLNIKQP